MDRLRAKTLLTAAGLLLALAPAASFACACGCGVFEVATGAVPSAARGLSLFFEYDFMDQNRNWSGTSSAPASANEDKEIKTDFFTAGAQYVFDQDWSVKLEAPYWNRAFTTDTGAGIATFRHSALGDIRLTGIYSGLSDDMTTGVIFGVKLPTPDSVSSWSRSSRCNRLWRSCHATSSSKSSRFSPCLSRR